MNHKSLLPTFKKNNIAIAFTCLGLIFSGTTYASTLLEGRVTDSSKTVYFEGAQVKIKELNLITTTSREGTFRFSNLPEGNYTLQINYVGAASSETKVNVTDGVISNESYVIGKNQDAIENIIVYGQRAGQASALNRQKNARNITSVVDASSIGKNPDQNAAEALQRLPGMFIERDQGEGRYVGIRGIDPNLNNVTINGANVPSAEPGMRSVAMDVIPSELVQSLEVSKSVTPDMDGSAVGGNIEVRSLSAFDRDDESYSLTAQGYHSALESSTSPKLSGSYTNIYELDSGMKIGLATALSYSKRDFASHNMETDGGWETTAYTDISTGDMGEALTPDEIEQRHYEIARERTGGALNLDFKVNDNDSYYLRSFISNFTDAEKRQRNEYKYGKGELDTSSVTNNSAHYTNAAMDRDTKDRFEEQTISSFVIGGEHQRNEWLVEYNLGYSKASEERPDGINVDFKAKKLNLGYNSTGPIPEVVNGSNAHDLDNFSMDQVESSNKVAKDTEISASFDISKNFITKNYQGEYKFGGKYRQREKNNDVQTIIYDDGFGGLTAANFEASSPNYGLGDFGPGLNFDALNKYVTSHRDDMEINEQESLLNSAGETYRSNEDIIAAYAMVSIDSDKWHAVAGIRYEGTNFDTLGSRVEIIEGPADQVVITEQYAEKTYHDFLPSINISYDFSDKFMARFAYSNTIARPSFDDSSATQIVETEVTSKGVIREASVGNPDLNPYESTNYDLSLEYYPGYIGVISAGLFHKNIDNFIIKEDVSGNGEWGGYSEVMQSVNGGEAKLTGVEFSWMKSFDSGLLLSANGTFIDASEQLPNQADAVGNVMLGYENDDFSARITATYKGESYQFTEGEFAVNQSSHTQVDFTTKYHLTNSTVVHFSAINLTDEVRYEYHGTSNYNYAYEQYGRSAELGITISSF